MHKSKGETPQWREWHCTPWPCPVTIPLDEKFHDTNSNCRNHCVPVSGVNVWPSLSINLSAIVIPEPIVRMEHSTRPTLVAAWSYRFYVLTWADFFWWIRSNHPSLGQSPVFLVGTYNQIQCFSNSGFWSAWYSNYC